MRVTTKGRYAVRAISNLALAGTGVQKSIRALSDEEGISPEFLEQIFYKLKKAGIINSQRGPSGGFSLAKAADQISLKDIFLAVDEGLDLTPCTACDDAAEFEHCGKTGTCMVHEVWREASDAIVNYFTTYNLQRIIDQNAGRSSRS